MKRETTASRDVFFYCLDVFHIIQETWHHDRINILLHKFIQCPRNCCLKIIIQEIYYLNISIL